MCGIFGIISNNSKAINKKDALCLISAARQRGKDSSGFLYRSNTGISINASRADYDITKLFEIKVNNSSTLFGHSRLITNSDIDNQPVIQGDIAVLHNGIITNTDEIWSYLNIKPKLKIDTETLIGLTNFYLKIILQTSCRNFVISFLKNVLGSLQQRSF